MVDLMAVNIDKDLSFHNLHLSLCWLLLVLTLLWLDDGWGIGWWGRVWSWDGAGMGWHGGGWWCGDMIDCK